MDWDIAALNAQLRNREQENEVLIAEVQRLKLMTEGVAALRAFQPRTVEERAWRVMLLYGFTQQATKALWKTCDFVDTPPLGTGPGAGSEYIGGLVRLLPGQDDDKRTSHEITHAAVDKLGLRGNWGPYKAALLRLVNGEGGPEAVTAARESYYHASYPNDPYGDEHLYVYPITNGHDNQSGLMGRIDLLPDYIRPFFEPIFKGVL